MQGAESKKGYIIQEDGVEELRFLITGSPGSGTRYTTELLRSVGVDVGHEQAFHHGWSEGKRRIGKTPHIGEVSWYGAVFLENFDIPTAHQVRHPLLNIRTMAGMEGWRTSKMHRATFERYVPQVLEYEDPILWAARFWLDWNTHCEVADVRWNIYDIEGSEIESFLYRADITVARLDRQIAALPQTIGTRRHPNPHLELAWEDLGEMKSEIHERAIEYGLEK